VGRTMLTRRTVHIVDILSDPDFTRSDISSIGGYCTTLGVPMLRGNHLIGVLGLMRTGKPKPFTDKQIELVTTFADQAVIAIENVRLFKEIDARTRELAQSVETLTALGEVSRAVSSTLEVENVLDMIVSSASQLAGADACSIYEYDEINEKFDLRSTHNVAPQIVEALRMLPLRKNEGVTGRAAESGEVMQIPDITQPGAYESRLRKLMVGVGYRAVLSVPLLREDKIIGSLSLTRKSPGEFSSAVVNVLKTFATQSALAIQNARLFREIEQKSSQLETANRHKSEFLANMSHELRTPLNAVIGFSEVLQQRMFGEINDKQLEYINYIHTSGSHLLSLINDILDLSKVEAGRMELDVTGFNLPLAIENSLALVRERATRHSIALESAVDTKLADIDADERKFKQVMLNLLSNAVKFTPEGGRITVGARQVDGVIEVSVTDTGVGIAAEDCEAVFEEFRQVGNDFKRKAEGTGLGLALARKFIELHGGRLWVTSEIGKGSTFAFTLPARADADTATTTPPVSH
ncbi:MAG: His Kinase (phosphoacceptor) domain protein, partial [Betaproteobacteria bacterium]|nr:His Kinase (phosphoacceptor) domain protein [Betaproteobacteria bacterium]